MEVKESKTKKKKGVYNTENEMKWGQAVQRGTQPSLTGCLAPSLSVIVASVWWICSHPVRGGYREKCCLSVRWGRCEICRKNRLVQVDMDPVNHCDPQLIDLFGAKNHGPEADVLQGTVFQKVLFFTLTVVVSWVKQKKKTKKQMIFSELCCCILNH